MGAGRLDGQDQLAELVGLVGLDQLDGLVGQNQPVGPG